MPYQIRFDSQEYTAREHGPRKNGSREPKYIEDGETAFKDSSGRQVYFGKKRGNRITFPADGSWWFIDDQDLYDRLFDLNGKPELD